MLKPHIRVSPGLKNTWGAEFRVSDDLCFLGLGESLEEAYNDLLLELGRWMLGDD